MRSTHACTPSFALSLLNIHVGCCLFSHEKHNKKKKIKSVVQALLVFLWCCLHVTFQKRFAQLCNTKEKKCGAHTHVHHLSQLSSPIFTSVVVYSRTSAFKFLNKQKQWSAIKTRSLNPPCFWKLHRVFSL